MMMANNLLINYERTEYDIKKFANYIVEIFGELAKEGAVKVNDRLVAPPDKCKVVFRYEIMPGGEHSLKVELLWLPKSSDDSEGGDLKVGKVEK